MLPDVFKHSRGLAYGKAVGFYPRLSGRIRLGRNGRFWPKPVIQYLDFQQFKGPLSTLKRPLG
ncbi:protein of unknown function [uncultured Woeseiaceae bacterium]|uniref:Uncharacterized protein n=1 Tax=uncultured Woeseiaceae bacterium TaxID=1983305 RepID=A0A7D9D2K5_9GAMM|nr:protein of unknown function [uncultured Woeseiaceae bacterium]